MNNAQRFAEEDFAPQVNDIIHCREVTRGIKETRVISPDGREVSPSLGFILTPRLFSLM